MTIPFCIFLLIMGIAVTIHIIKKHKENKLISSEEELIATSDDSLLTTEDDNNLKL